MVNMVMVNGKYEEESEGLASNLGSAVYDLR